jgi:aarF domain-containing kinase
MNDAHVRAGATVGEPFGSPGVYDFGAHSQMTKRVSQLGATMLQHRLTAPPIEAYSLHRRLSGAFLANIRLKSRVPCKQLFDSVYQGYNFGEGEASPGGEQVAEVVAKQAVA